MSEDIQKVERLEGKVLRLKERMNQRELKLKSILDLTDAINNNLATDELISRFRETVENDLRITKLLFLARIDSKWQCILKIGTEESIGVDNLDEEFEGMHEIELVQSSENETFKDWDLYIPVIQEERPLAYLLIGDKDDDDLSVSPIVKHMRFIQTMANIITVAIENKALFAKSLEQERMKAELHLAAEMQSLMVATGKLSGETYQVATYYKPHQQVGGDFYDFVELDGGNAFFCMADVSGKGVSAAFLMANLQAHIKAILKFTDWTLESMAKELNEIVNETVNGDRFVTMFLGYYDAETRKIEYVNAGHNPPVLLNGDELDLLEEGTVGIGMLKDLPFINKGIIRLNPNACLVCYTDGVVEIENEEEEEYGTDKLGVLMKESHSKGDHIEDLVSAIIHSIDLHRGDNPYFDDTALLCCKFL